MTVRMRFLAAAGAAVLGVIAGAPISEACPYCASAASASNSGYLIATVTLGIMPFALLGGLVLWLRRHERASSASARTRPATRSASSSIDGTEIPR